jgi:tetratricopeptide (TPR) repeat protein
MNPMPSLDRRPVFWAAWAILLLTAAFCYSPCLEGPFVYDDSSLVRDNLRIRSIANVKDWFSTTLLAEEDSSRYFRPMLLAAFWLDHAIWDSNTFGYHLLNLVWHLANVVLMASLARRAGWDRRAAYLAAWLFALHPLHAQAVCYISGRGDVQFLGLSLLACHALLNAWKYPRREMLWNAAAATLFACAVFTKELALVTLPWAALLAWLRNEPRRTWGLSAGFLGAALALVLFARLTASDPSPIQTSQVPLPATLHFILFFRAIGFYASHFVAPIVLALDRSIIAPTPLHHFYFLLGLVLFAGALYAGWNFHLRQRRRALFCLGWSAVAFLPVSNLIRLSATAADHWLYPASIGLAWGVALTVAHLTSRASRAWKTAVYLCIGALVLWWAARLHTRSGDWQSGIALYRANLAQGVASTRILNNYGLELAHAQQYSEALHQFERALQLDPTNRPARANHGFTLYLTGRDSEGREELRMLTRDFPKYQHGWIALMLTHRNDPVELRRIGEKALETGYPFPKVELLLSTIGAAPAEESVP